MRKAPRNFLFALALIIFAVAAPILVLYALGYRYESDTHELRKTATIGLEFESQSLRVYFDDVFIADKKDSVIIPGVTSAPHRITVTKNDAISWEQDVETSPGVVTWLSNILLYRANLGRTAITKPEDDVLAAKVSTTQNTLALVITHKGDNNPTIEIRDKKTQNIATQISEKALRDSLNNTVASFEYSDMFFTQNDSWIILPIKLTDNGSSYVALSTKDGSFYSLANYISKDVTSVLYADSNDQLVYFYVNGGKRKTFNLQKKTLSSESSTLYSFHKSFASYSIENNQNVCSLVETLDVIATTKTITNIECGNIQVLITPNNNLVLQNFSTHQATFFDTRSKSLTALDQDASKFTFAENPKSGDVVAYVAGSEIHAYLSDTNEKIVVAKSTEAVKDMNVNTLGTHLLYLAGNSLTATEIVSDRTAEATSWGLFSPLPFLLPGSVEQTIFVGETAEKDNGLYELKEITLYDL